VNGAEQALATLRDYVERSTHWQEGGATRHDAILALSSLRPVGSILRGHLKPQPEPWCKDILLYSPDNKGDNPENRVMLYGASS
jgi:hypothetical protein